MRKIVPFVIAVACGSAVMSARGAAEERTLWLAIDDHALPLKNGLCYYLSKPKVRRQAVLTPNRDNPKAPDHLASHFYGTVLHDEGKFRMWYYPVSYRENPADLTQGPVCYAESDDGIRWTKPNLGQVEFKGSKDNNALALPDRTTQCAAVIKDDTDPDPRRRYKMVYTAAHKGVSWTFRPATSPDGIHWTARRDWPVAKFIEMGSFYRHDGLYVVHGQSTGHSEAGRAEGRQGYGVVSPDFEHWEPALVDTFRLPEPARTGDRGYGGPYDQVHLGVGATSFGNVAVGLYGLWHNPPVDQRNKTGWYGFGVISCDFGLVVSNDGLHFREPVKGHVYLSSTESPAAPLGDKNYPTILCQANGILNVGDETRIYHGRWRNGPYGLDYWAEVALATLPRDRWGALGLSPNHTEGWVWSAPITLPKEGLEVVLNGDATDHMRVEIADVRFNSLDDYAGPNAGSTRTDGGLDCAVVWPAGDPASLAGKTVRLRISLKKGGDSHPRLYAVYLSSGNE